MLKDLGGEEKVKELSEKHLDQVKLLQAYRKIDFSDDASQWVPAGYNDNSLVVIFACNKYTETAHAAGLKDLECAVADGKLMKDTLLNFGFKLYSYQNKKDEKIGCRWYNIRFS